MPLTRQPASERMRKVAIGSVNKSKVRGVKRAWELMGPASFVAARVPAPYAQPLSWTETLEGALARAEKALEMVSDADYGVGVEAGLVPLPVPSGYVDVQAAVVLDKRGRVSVGLSSGFEIPYVFLPKVASGLELGVVAESWWGRPLGEEEGVIGVLTKGMVTREDLTFQAVVMALVPWVNPSLYGRLVDLDKFRELLRDSLP